MAKSPRMTRMYEKLSKAETNLVLKCIKVKIEELKNDNKDLSYDEILDYCGITKREKEIIEIYNKANYNYDELKNLNNYLADHPLSKDLLLKLTKFSRDTKFKTSETKYAKLLKEVSLFTSTCITDNSNKKLFKKGTKLKFAYYQEISNLYVFHFGKNMTFPLREGDFEWL